MRRQRLVHGGDAGGEHGLVEVAELVHPAPEREPELVEVDLVLGIGPELRAVLGIRRDRDVEDVAPHVAAVAEDVLAAQHHRVARLQIVGLGPEAQHDRQSLQVRAQQVRSLGVHQVREGVDLEGSLRVADLAVAHVGLVVGIEAEVEGSDAAVDDPLRARDAGAIGHAPAASRFLVHADVHLGLVGGAVAQVGEHAVGGSLPRAHRFARVQGVMVRRDPAHGPREGVGVVEPAADPVRPAVVGGLVGREARAVGAAGVEVLSHGRGVPVEDSPGQGEARPHRSRRLPR